MPTLRPILSRDHQREFETPPTFNYAQRRFFFQITPDIKTLLATFETTANKTGFLVQLGYFRATCRFFSPTTFLTKDWEFAARRVTPKGSMLPIRIYADTTARRHRQLILQALGVMPFTGAVGELPMNWSLRDCGHHRYLDGCVIFSALIGWKYPHTRPSLT